MKGNEALDLTVSGLPSTERIARRTLAVFEDFRADSFRRFSLEVELWRVRLQEEPDTIPPQDLYNLAETLLGPSCPAQRGTNTKSLKV